MKGTVKIMTNYNDLFLKALNDIEKLNIRLNNLTDRVIKLESEDDYLENNLNINKKNKNQEKKKLLQREVDFRKIKL